MAVGKDDVSETLDDFTGSLEAENLFCEAAVYDAMSDDVTDGMTDGEIVIC